MKKLLSVLLTCVMLLSTTVCFAHSHTGTASGTTYHLSNNWREYDKGEVFFYMDFSLSDESIKSVRDCEDVCNEFYDLLCSDSKISSDMGEINGANVSIKTEKESKKNEIYNGVEYLRFEKKYSARATGFYDTYYYRTTLFTVKNDFTIYRHNILFFIDFHISISGNGTIYDNRLTFYQIPHIFPTVRSCI